MGREPVSAELRAELELHVELRARDNIRSGMDPRAAWADARRRFGNLDEIAARCAGRDSRHTLRAVGLTCLLALVLAVIDVLRAAALSDVSDATLVAGLTALSVLTLALTIVACCLSLSPFRSAR